MPGKEAESLFSLHKPMDIIAAIAIITSSNLKRTLLKCYLEADREAHW